MAADGTARLSARLRGAVQGVGFRPFVYRLARSLGLSGWVANGPQGVEVEAEGPRADLERFLERLPREAPPRARIRSLDVAWLPAAGLGPFAIRASARGGRLAAVVLADGATCAACLREVLDPADRRHGYPFANCTDCGPRFTIVESLPYDRPRTTMKGFAMCAACRREYEDPLDRRFHAQPNACPDCGPSLRLWDARGETLAAGPAALEGAARALEAGRVVAAKGLGGFHLLADARDDAVLGRLRAAKHREEKPLALMVADLDAARLLCHVPEEAARLLGSPEAPIVLLQRRSDAVVSALVAPCDRRLGVMLPCTPLHHLLLGRLGTPLVATSGNQKDEPIATDELEALRRLSGIADLFLVHDRPIARHVDDSVFALADGAPYPLRRARGHAPLPVALGRTVPPLLALGGHLKNVVALAVGDEAFLSQHIGDLETPEALAAFESVIGDLLDLYGTTPVAVAHDLHPDYASTRWLFDLGRDAEGPAWRRTLAALPRVGVQHHHAHLAACLAEHGLAGEALGVTWDGTGLGTDGTVWGGEFLRGDARGCERVASLRPFRLPGGEAAIHEPWRVALALLWETRGEAALEADLGGDVGSAERRLLGRVLATGTHAPVTTSAGRLFDGVAALVGLRSRVAFEGQAAMALEQAADPFERNAYPLPLARGPDGPWRLDWGPLLEALLEDRRRGVGIGTMSARFHNALVEGIVRIARECGSERVMLSGGCFQNMRLLEGARLALATSGFDVRVHRQVPPNDGGLALGQIAVLAARLERGEA